MTVQTDGHIKRPCPGRRGGKMLRTQVGSQTTSESRLIVNWTELVVVNLSVLLHLKVDRSKQGIGEYPQCGGRKSKNM